MSRLAPSFAARARGLSLVELLVAMTIGLIVIGVGFSSYLNVAANTRNATAMARMTEDASIALGILRANIAMAGYSRPIGTEMASDNLGTGGATRNYEVMTRAFKGGTTAAGDDNNFIAGCDGSFTDPKAHELDISQLAGDCASPSKNARGNPDAIAVVYEADADNTTYPDKDGKPTDCLGNALPDRSGDLDKGDLRLVSNKFYIDTTTAGGATGLYCQGNGRSTPTSKADADKVPAGVSPQMIVENITDMQITYGIADFPTGARVPSPNALAYVKAADLQKLTGTEKWSRVVSVRICVEVQSPSTIKVNATEQPQYLDCNGTVQNNNTGVFVHTFTTTVVLHNRINNGIGT